MSSIYIVSGSPAIVTIIDMPVASNEDRELEGNKHASRPGFHDGRAGDAKTHSTHGDDLWPRPYARLVA